MLLIIVFVYLLLLYLAIAYYAILVVRRIDGNTQMLVKKAANFAIILTCRILTLPFIGLGMMFPCNSTPNDPACTGMNAAILGACGIIITVLTVTLNIGFSICYYIKYPLAKCWMAREDNYDELGKLLLKLGGPIYFFIDPVLQYKFLYFLGLMALQAASLFFFRMFTLNNYIRRNE